MLACICLKRTWAILLTNGTGNFLSSHLFDQELPCCYGAQRFIFMFTKYYPWTPSWASSFHFIPSQFISLQSNLILYSDLHLGLLHGLFPSDLPTKILYAFFVSFERATCLPRLILIDLITLIIFGEAYKSYSCTPCNLYYIRNG